MARRPPPPPPADWSAFVPPGQRFRVLCHRAVQRLRQTLTSRAVLLGAILLLYLAFCLGLLLWGPLRVSLLAFLPLLLGPPVGYLAYWLVWQEFHK